MGFVTRLPHMIRLDLFGDKLCLVGHCRESILSLLVGLTPASSSDRSRKRSLRPLEFPRQTIKYVLLPLFHSYFIWLSGAPHGQSYRLQPQPIRFYTSSVVWCLQRPQVMLS